MDWEVVLSWKKLSWLLSFGIIFNQRLLHDNIHDIPQDHQHHHNYSIHNRLCLDQIVQDNHSGLGN